MISLEKWMILTPLQKLPNKAGDFGKIIVSTCFEWLPKVQKIAQSGHTDYHLVDQLVSHLYLLHFTFLLYLAICLELLTDF